jgi:hypothetical protein
MAINAIKELFAKWSSDHAVLQDQSRAIASVEDENVKLKSENKMMKDYLCSKDPSAPFCSGSNSGPASDPASEK